MKPDGIQRSATYHRSSSNAVNANPKPPEFQPNQHTKRGTHHAAIGVGGCVSSFERTRLVFGSRAMSVDGACCSRP